MRRISLERFRGSLSVFILTIWGIAWTAPASQTGFAQARGYWHIQDNQVVDQNDRPVRIAGVNWYGFETRDHVPHGLTQQDYHSILRSIENMGFNVIRLPFSNEMIESPTVPAKIAFTNKAGTINLDLRNLSAIEIMDKIIDAAGELGLHIILDNHRSDAGDGPQSSGLWYTERYPESAWIADWQMLSRRYKSKLTKAGDPVVIGVDLRDEPHSISGGGACWMGDPARGGCPATNTSQNWTTAAIRAGNAVLFENPNLLIFVEGTDCYAGDCTFWGGNLQGARSSRVVLTQPDRVVYSVHDYGPVEYHHQWFNADTTSETLANTWMKYWAFMIRDNIAPIWIGEFGTSNDSSDAADYAPGSQGQWFTSLVAFLSAHPSIHWTYWALNGEDRYGLLTQDYSRPVNDGSPRQRTLFKLLNTTR